MTDFALTGKTALITGASSGLGARIAFALAESGANLLLVARRKTKLVEQQQLIIKQFPTCSVKILTYDLGNISSDAKWLDLASQLFALTPTIDILCNVAGVNLREKWQDITSESWDTTLNLNLKVPFFLARQLVPKMQANSWGKIINIASLQSARAFADSIPYGASKGGVCQLTRAMAQAWSQYGIGVNAIAPGFFPTELTAPVYENPTRLKQLAEQTAIKRNGQLTDIDGLSVFLASHASDYITGQTIYLDGGFTAS